jgi:hypothetical protein
MLGIGDHAFEQLSAIDDADELCRRLLASPCGWGSSTRHSEAIELLANLQNTSGLPASFVALMVGTCSRWDRVTARLIAALQDSALLDDAELDELAESLLLHEQVIAYPLAWVSPQWLDVDITTAPAAATQSTRTRSLSAASLSSRRYVDGRRTALCGPARYGSGSCCTPPNCSSRATATR